MMQKQTIFITGGLGYIGAPTAHTLAKNGYQVVVFDISHSPLGHLHESNIYHVIGDIRKIEDLKYAFSIYHPHIVLHLAALTSVTESEKNKKLYKETNVMGTKNICDIMEQGGCNKLLFASSASIYAETKESIHEEQTLDPISYYGKTKIDAERLFKEIRTSTGLCCVILTL